MSSKHLLVPSAIAALLPLLGCSGHSAPAKVDPPSASAAAPAETPKACDLVTESEMAAILGAPVVATGKNRSVETSCAYAAASGISPSAEVKVEWGDGAAAMMGAGMAARLEPGLTDPLAGIGDQAVIVGPVLMIRKGEDLITIMLSGVDDVAGRAKRVYGVAAPRMPAAR